MSKQDNEAKDIPIAFSDNEDEPEASDDPLAPDDAATGGDPPDGAADGSTAALQAQIDQLTQERSTLLDQVVTPALFYRFGRSVYAGEAATAAVPAVTGPAGWRS